MLRWKCYLYATMKYIFLTGLIATLLTTVSCNKEKKQFDAVSADMEQRLLFNAGSSWVYVDQLDGTQDSFVVDSVARTVFQIHDFHGHAGGMDNMVLSRYHEGLLVNHELWQYSLSNNHLDLQMTLLVNGQLRGVKEWHSADPGNSISAMTVYGVTYGHVLIGSDYVTADSTGFIRLNYNNPYDSMDTNVWALERMHRTL